MANISIKLALVDSGLPENAKKSLGAECRFIQSDEEVERKPVIPDPLGHGSLIYEIIHHYSSGSQLFNAQVFDKTGMTSAAAVAEAVDWACEKNVDVINLSLGLRQDREILRTSCEKATGQDIILIASSPAQGGDVYPSAYSGVIRATGDARCAVGEISFLDNKQADFGGCARLISDDMSAPPRIGGASVGTAHITGKVITYLENGGKKETVRDWLVSQRKYLHSERRTK